MEFDPYLKSRNRRLDYELEFEIFKTEARKTYLALIENDLYFISLKRFARFWMVSTGTDTVQFSFGPRKMGRNDLNGQPAEEKGLSLVYSIGPTAAVNIQLYPLFSGLGRTHEDFLHVGLGYYTAYQLTSRLKTDLGDLITYGYVSSIDAESTWKQRCRVWFLRKIKAKQIEGKFEGASIKAAFFGGLATSANIAFRAYLAAMFKPMALAALLILALLFGWDWLTPFVLPK